MSVRALDLVIATCTALSEAFSFNYQKILGVVTPGTWTAADVTFEIESPTGTFVKVVDRGGAIYKLTGIATSTSEMHIISGDANQAHVAITGQGAGRIVSTNTASEANINQTGARTVTVILDD